jgi:CubicO group peptidase (beta-lactamase class C family)
MPSSQQGKAPGLPQQDAQLPRVEPRDAGFDPAKLRDAGAWLAEAAGEAPFRAAAVRHGQLVAEWCGEMDASEHREMASAAKSVYSCMLGIAIEEGKVGSADDRVVDYYPEMMDVPEGRGPKPGRHAKPEDRGITFRQLICNTSGYMKPDEAPGSTFHYQTFGMNILCHALAKAYGLYDSAAPDRLPGPGKLAAEKVRDPIGASWGHTYMNFPHEPEALIGIFGNYLQIHAGLYDLARLGMLWLHFGRWGDRQVVPEDWVREAVRTAPDIRGGNCAARGERFEGEALCYGHGFWTNEQGLLWPSLPRDSFAASGAGRIHVWVCPSLDLVVVQSPGVFDHQRDNDSGLLGRVVAALA